MTNFKTMLLAATALTMVSGVAFGGSGNISDTDQAGAANEARVDQDAGVNNTSYLGQTGDRNDADVTQSSNSSSQFFNPNGNKFGTAADPALQTGDDNSVSIRQDFVGNNANEVGTGGSGFNQTGNDNSATIVQNGSRNVAFEIQQNSEGGSGNILTITQGRAGDLSAYAFNRVNSVQQTNTGSLANTAAITQQGSTGSGSFNRIDRLSQDGSDNAANVQQIGNRNALEDISQAGIGNSLTLTIQGNYNGSDGLDGLNEQAVGSFGETSRGFAAGAGVIQGSVLQIGNDNAFNYSIVGDSNLLGSRQTGNDHVISGSVSGDFNELAVSQTTNGGSGHSEAAVEITGSDNDIAVSQTISSGARLGLVDLGINGSGNSLNVVQGQGGNGRNSIVDISIDGDDNNSVAAFTGDALDALSNSSRRLAGSGQVRQGGSGNQLFYDVVADADGSSDSNQFAFYQTGTNNTITGTTTGDSNQAVVVQGASGNTATFTQVGNGNNLGVSQ